VTTSYLSEAIGIVIKKKFNGRSIVYVYITPTRQAKRWYALLKCSVRSRARQPGHSATSASGIAHTSRPHAGLMCECSRAHIRYLVSRFGLSSYEDTIRLVIVIRDNPLTTLLRSFSFSFLTENGCRSMIIRVYLRVPLDVLKLALYALAHQSLTSRLMCQGVP